MIENESTGNDDELELEPLDPETEAVREMNIATYGPVSQPEVEPDNPKFQFGVVQLFITMTIVAVCVALVEWFSIEIAAGILGTLTLCFLGAATRLGREYPKLKIYWFVLLLVYAIFSVYAAIRFIEF